MRAYVCGPMTGLPDFNFPAFFDAASALRSLGHGVENPADNDGPTCATSLAGALAAKEAGATWADYMRRDLPRIAKCDAVVVLPGWQRSRGASLEVDIATRLGMPIMCILRTSTFSTVRSGVFDEYHKWTLVPRIRAMGLSGYARSGKDTVGGILVAKHGYIRASFADKLKELTLLIDPIVGYPGELDDITLFETVDAVGWGDAKENPEVRRLLQAIGTGVRDIIGPDTWVNLAMRDLPDGSKVVFTDARFDSEANAIKAAGGEVWRVERPGHGPVNGHVSETALDAWPFDAYICNDAGLDVLAHRVAVTVTP